MKEKAFEVIVPAYDALEAELEGILGGIGCEKCKRFTCTPYTPPNAGNCVPSGAVAMNASECCSGVIIIISDDSQICQ